MIYKTMQLVEERKNDEILVGISIDRFRTLRQLFGFFLGY